MSLKDLPWKTAGALSPGSADDKSSLIMTPVRAWLTRFRTKDKLIGKEFAHRTCRRGAPALLDQANLTRFTPGFDRHLKGACHSIWVGCDCDRGIYQNRVRPHLHRFRRLARRAQSSINHHWDGGLFDDDFDLCPGFNPAITSDWRTERHHRRSANILQSFCQHRIGIDVGQDSESFLH